MHKLFDSESGIMQALGDLCDLIVLNLFALLCSLPLITFGASVCGLFTALRAKKRGRGEVYRSFFRGFGQHFRRATIAHLILSGILIYLVCCWYLWGLRLCLLLAFAGGILFSLFAAWYYPLLVYADGTVPNLFKRTCMCCVGYLPRTLGMAIVNLAPAVIMLAASESFVRYFCWILLFWFALAASVSMRLLKKPLRDMGLSD